MTVCGMGIGANVRDGVGAFHYHLTSKPYAKWQNLQDAE